MLLNVIIFLLAFKNRQKYQRSDRYKREDQSGRFTRHMVTELHDMVSSKGT